MSAKSTNILILTTICLLLATSSASAASTSTGGMMMDLMDQFHTASVSWTTRALQIGNWIFYTLAVLELTWAAALWAMEKDSASSLIVALVRKFMVLGFFYTFLIMAPSWIPAIINSLQDTGAQIGGTTVGAVTPMSIVGHGINVINAIWKAFSNSALGSLKAMATAIVIGFLLIAVSIAIMLSFIYIAIEYVMTVIESYIVVGMGLVLMGFSGSQWTRDFSQKYIGYAFSVGVKLMVLMLLLATIITVTNTWPADVRATFTGKDMFAWIQPMFMIAGSSILMALLAIKIPSLASSLLSGAPSLGGAGAVAAGAAAGAATAGLAVGAGKLAGASVGAAGPASKGLVAAAAGGMGAIQAAGAATNLASTGMAQAVGGAASAATASGHTPGSASHALSTAGNLVSGLGGAAASSMKGAAGSAKSAVSSATSKGRESFGSAVSNSAGGKLAQSLDAKTQTLKGSCSQATNAATNPVSSGVDNTAPGGAGSASPSSVPPPAVDGQTGSEGRTPVPPGGHSLSKAFQQLPLDHGAVAAAAPKLDHHEH